MDERPLIDEAELAAALAAPFPTVEIPPAQEADLLAAARRRGETIRTGRRRRRALAAVAALAAAAALVLAIRWRRPTPAVAGDVDRDGRVDILDAFALAKHVAAGRAGADAPEAARWDLDGDGVVGQGDVDWIARRAVTLEVVQ